MDDDFEMLKWPLSEISRGLVEAYCRCIVLVLASHMYGSFFLLDSRV